MTPREERLLWESLLKHPAWQMLCELGDQRVSNLAGDVCRPMLHMEEALLRNTASGEMLGIHYMLAQPEQRIEDLTLDIRRAEADSANSVDEDDAA